MNIQGFADDLARRHARIQGIIGVLENHLEFPSARAQLRPGQAGDVLPFQPDTAGCWLNQFHDGPAQGCLAASAFANQAEGFTRPDAETHIIHRFNALADAAEHPLLHRIMDFEIFDLQHE